MTPCETLVVVTAFIACTGTGVEDTLPVGKERVRSVFGQKRIHGIFRSPHELWKCGHTLSELNINAVLAGHRQLNAELIRRCRREGARGFAFMSHGVPINEIKGGEIYCTLLRSVSVLSADGGSGPLVPTPEAMELGEHHYSYSIYPYSGTWRQAVLHRRGSELSQTLLGLQVDTAPHQKEYKGFALEPDNLIMTALKKAERDNSVIMRFFETKGEGCRAMLRVPSQARAVQCVSLLEEGDAESRIVNGVVEMDVDPFEIVTLKLLLEA